MNPISGFKSSPMLWLTSLALMPSEHVQRTGHDLVVGTV
jgi:hypothetical protein